MPNEDETHNTHDDAIIIFPTNSHVQWNNNKKSIYDMSELDDVYIYGADMNKPSLGIIDFNVLKAFQSCSSFYFLLF